MSTKLHVMNVLLEWHMGWTSCQCERSALPASPEGLLYGNAGELLQLTWALGPDARVHRSVARYTNVRQRHWHWYRR